MLPREVVAEPILAWRVWAVQAFGLLCPLVVQGGAWTPGAAGDRATCLRSAHDAPHASCTCGYWAVKDREAAILIGERSFPVAPFFAIGQVQLWGTVVEHDDGYRAEFARPYDVTISGTTMAPRFGVVGQRLVERVRETYACEARYEELELGRGFGVFSASGTLVFTLPAPPRRNSQRQRIVATLIAFLLILTLYLNVAILVDRGASVWRIFAVAISVAGCLVGVIPIWQRWRS